MGFRLSILFLVLVSFLGALGISFAATSGEINIPKQTLVDKRTLLLNGTGMRKATIFKVKVYSAALYLEKLSHDPKEILNSNQMKKVELHFVHDVPADKMKNAWNES